MSAERWSAVAAWLGLFGSTLSGLGAWKAYRMAKANDERLKSDEEIVGGRLQKPDLQSSEHRKCVLWTQLVNRSLRRAVVNDVRVFGSNGDAIDVEWGGRIDQVGTPQGAGGILAIDSESELYLRRIDGKSFSFGTTVKIMHGFKGSPLLLKYELRD